MPTTIAKPFKLHPTQQKHYHNLVGFTSKITTNHFTSHEELIMKDILGLHEQGVFFCQLLFHVLQLDLKLDVLQKKMTPNQHHVDKLNLKEVQK